MMRGLEHFSYEKRPRELALFSQDHGRLTEDLINVCKSLKNGCQEGGALDFFQWCLVLGQQAVGTNWSIGGSM